MQGIITIEGIDRALTQLGSENKTALKYRLLTIIRAYYGSVNSIESLRKIDTDELVTTLWETGDDSVVIKNRRKNLKSIKSAINTELTKLYRDGQNPEGIIIGPDNVFVMSDEARDNALKSFKNLSGPDESFQPEYFRQYLNYINEFLSSPTGSFDPVLNADPGTLEELKKVIRIISEKIGLDNVSARYQSGDSHTDGGDKRSEHPGGYMGGGGAGQDSGSGLYQENSAIPAVDDGTPPVEAGHGDDPVESLEAFDTEDIQVDDLPVEVDEPDTVDDEIDDTEIVDIVEEVDDNEEIDTDELTEAADSEPGDMDDVVDVIDADQIDETAEELPEEIDNEDVDDSVDELADIEEVEVDDIPVGSEDVPDGKEGRMLEEEIPEEFETPDSENPGLMSEKFNNSLAAMDKYYNQYIFIPGGSYAVGVGHPRWNEKPEKIVHLPPFYFGKFPVTNALFEIFVEKTGYTTTAEKSGHGTVYHGRRLHQIRNDSSGRLVYSGNSELIIKEIKGACWYQPFGPGSTLYKKRNHPVVQVSLEDAMAFAAWTGKRLPTEEEWEAAARTAHGHVFPWGDEWEKDACNTEESLIGDTTPVDRYLKSANEFGIMDLLGNVMEWTQTRSEYVSGDNNSSVLCVTKGGSFISANGICLPRRSKLQPESHSNILGFRCVAS